MRFYFFRVSRMCVHFVVSMAIDADFGILVKEELLEI